MIWRRRRPGLACSELVELVTDYLDGALSKGERARFEAHIAGCDDCTVYVAQFTETIAALAALPPTSPPPATRRAAAASSAAGRRTAAPARPTAAAGRARTLGRRPRDERLGDGAELGDVAHDLDAVDDPRVARHVAAAERPRRSAARA